MDKILTLKEFREEVTPFVKAYKRPSASNTLDILHEAYIDDIIWFISIYKWSEKECDESIFILNIHIYNGEEDEDGEHIEHKIESNNTMTEIVDFLCFEYSREVLKRVESVKQVEESPKKEIEKRKRKIEEKE